jgi:hypothetical protein
MQSDERTTESSVAPPLLMHTRLFVLSLVDAPVLKEVAVAVAGLQSALPKFTGTALQFLLPSPHRAIAGMRPAKMKASDEALAVLAPPVAVAEDSAAAPKP